MWTLTVQPAGVPSRELAALLHGALTHFGKPAVEPATARPSEPRGNEREFDLPV